MAGQGEGASDLGAVVSQLGPYLGRLGLVPSLVIPYMKIISGQQAGLQAPFPSKEVVKRVFQHERQSHPGAAGEEGVGKDLAVQYFVEQMLETSRASSSAAAAAAAAQRTLEMFMEALVYSNNSPDRPNPNLWRVHDILRLATVYFPLHHAMMGMVEKREAEGRVVVMNDMAGLITDLNQQRVLSPANMAAALDVLQSRGGALAMDQLLVSLYTARVDLLKHEFLNPPQALPSSSSTQQEDAATEEREEEVWVRWLRTLVQSVEGRFGGGGGEEGIVRELPSDLLTVDTWNSAYERMAYGGLGRTLPQSDDEDSDDNASAISDNDTVVPENNIEEDGGETSVSTEPSEIPRERDVERETRRQRTEEYVFGTEGAAIPLMMKCVHHKRQVLDILQCLQQYEEAHHDHQSDGGSSVDAMADALSMEESFSDIVSDSPTLSSLSTENNSQVTVPNSQEKLKRLTQTFLPSKLGGDTNEDREITLRDYQEEVISSARNGRNVVIILPTGTGKTFPVIKYAQEHLSGKDMLRPRRVVFLAPKVKLAFFQYLRFLRYFPQHTYFRCGRVRSSAAPFAELLNSYKVFVMTPMCLVEAVRHKDLQLGDFSLMVLDECHHVALGRHAYRVLMDLYMDFKLQRPDGAQSEAAADPQLPQVIGLTASPDVGQAKTEVAAGNHIREMCFAMDVDHIGVARTHLKQLQECTNQPQHEMHTCPPREKDGFKKAVERLMQHIEDKMLLFANLERGPSREMLLKTLAAPVNQRGQIRYCQWACNLENCLVDLGINKDLATSLLSMAEMLTLYQRSLTLNEDCESQYALEMLQRQVTKMETETPAHARLERQLLDHFKQEEEELQELCQDPKDYNPKLRMLESILLDLLNKYKEQCACMVFVRTVELSKAIQKWVQNHPVLKQLRPGRVTGTRRGQQEERGMTRNETAEALSKFNTGEHRMVVCTSAAEEGLDFQSCNIVIRYDYVTTMIAMVQTRGRARRMDSQYCVLGNVVKGNLQKEEENLALERLMNKALHALKDQMDHNPNAYLQAMTRWQLQQLQIRKEAEKLAFLKRQRSEITGDTFRLLCRKCQTEACQSADIRFLDECGYAVVGDALGDRWSRHDLEVVDHYKRNLVKEARVVCHKCGRSWGSLNRYIPTGRLFPLLKLENFILQNVSSGQLNKAKLKWSKAPFDVQDITDEELGVQ